jgi:hypothetical protein
VKKQRGRSRANAELQADANPTEFIQVSVSQVHNPTQLSEVSGDANAEQVQAGTECEDRDDCSEDSESDLEYMPHSEDSGEESEVVELRKHARKFKKNMRSTKSWIGKEAVPVDLIANIEEHVEEQENDWNYDSSDEDYSYDEDSDG